MRNDTPQSRSRLAARLFPQLAIELFDLRRALLGPFESYQPERHYMRGPGPKWHAKHGGMPT
jgi:hypothetical protein